MAATITYTVAGGEMLSQRKGGADYDYLPNPLGNIKRTIATGQSLRQQYLYSPWGESDPVSDDENASTPFQFIGAYGGRTQDVGGVYFRARTYSPTYARWLTVDPLWPHQHAYGYADESPTTFLDPLGLLKMTFRFGAFIHQRHGKWLDVGDPLWWYRGDFRDRGQEGSYRVYSETAIQTNLLNTSYAVEYVNNHAGSSTRKHGIDGHTETKRADLPDSQQIRKAKSGGCSANVIMGVSVTNPWAPFLVKPFIGDKYIDYVINITVRVVAVNVVSVQVHGYHDQFPDYELITSFTKKRPWYWWPAPDYTIGLGINTHFIKSGYFEAYTPEDCCC